MKLQVSLVLSIFMVGVSAHAAEATRDAALKAAEATKEAADKAL